MLLDNLPNGKTIIYNNNLYYSNNGKPTQLALQSLVQQMQSVLNTAYTPSNKPYAIGQYDGNGNLSRTISIGFTAIAILIVDFMGSTYDKSELPRYYNGGLLITNGNIYKNKSSNITMASIVSGGFRVVSTEIDSSDSHLRGSMNDSDSRYYYIAFK